MLANIGLIYTEALRRKKRLGRLPDTVLDEITVDLRQ
jgi:hypothetical protein